MTAHAIAGFNRPTPFLTAGNAFESFFRNSDPVLTGSVMQRLDALYKKKYDEYVNADENKKDPNGYSSSRVNYGVKATADEIGQTEWRRIDEILAEIKKSGRLSKSERYDDDNDGIINLGEYSLVKKYLACGINCL